MSEGIDVYVANQIVTSWSQVRAAGIEWCYQKVSDGSTTRSINGGPFAGVLQGGYHFSQPGSPVDQANLLVNRCEALKLTDLNPALDLEDNPPGSGRANIPDSQKAAFAIAFGRQVHARGHGFTLYAGDYVWKIIYNQLMKGLPDTFRWVARYRTAPPDTPYDAWQYTSSGSCPGIRAGSLDRSRGKTPLNSRNADMPLTTDDLNAIEARIDAKIRTLVPDIVTNVSRFKVLATDHDSNNPNANSPTVWTFGGRNIVDMLMEILGRTSVIAELKNLIIADDANDVTAEAVANALSGLIQAQIVPAVVSSVDAALKDKELNIDNAELSASIVSGIKELTFKAV